MIPVPNGDEPITLAQAVKVYERMLRPWTFVRLAVLSRLNRKACVLEIAKMFEECK